MTPDDHRSLGQALQALSAGNVGVAKQLHARLVATWPEDPDVLYLAGEISCAEGQEAAAVDHFRQAIARAPVPGLLRLRLAELLLFLRRRHEARELLDMVRIDPQTRGEAWSLLGRAYAKCNDIKLGLECHQRAAAENAGSAGSRFEVASTAFFLGETELAAAAIEEVLRLAAPQEALQGHARYLRASLRRQTAADNHVTELRSVLERGLPNPDARSATAYALAKELEDLGDAAGAEASLLAATALRKQMLRPDVRGETEAMAQIEEAWSSQAMDAIAEGDSDASPIFVIGLPRTGTTLVESILLRDSSVVSAGELLDLPQILGQMAWEAGAAGDVPNMAQAALRLDFARLGEDYARGAIEAVRAARPTQRPIDKLPVNFLYAGMIAKALPSARIVHLTRDPLDAAWAIHKTLFAAAYHWSSDLAQLGKYILAYRRLMAHWHRVLPGRIFDVAYEQLVTQPETTASDLLAWCGLADGGEAAYSRPVVTASAAQVREPIHARSIGRWRQHEVLLKPLRDAFESAGLY